MRKYFVLGCLVLGIIFCTSYIAQAQQNNEKANAGIDFYYRDKLIGKFQVKAVNGIDYISVQDMVKILNFPDFINAGYIDGKVECQDNLKEDGTITYHAEFPKNSVFQKNFSFNFAENTLYHLNPSTGIYVSYISLDDLGLKLFRENDTGYIPLCLLGFFTELRGQLYKSAADKYYLLDGFDLLLGFYEPVTTSEDMPADLKRTTFLYFLQILDKYRRPVDRRGIDINKYREAYLAKAVDASDSSGFYNVLNDALKEIQDLHSEIGATGYNHCGYLKSYRSILQEQRADYRENANSVPVLAADIEGKKLSDDIGYIRVPSFLVSPKEFDEKIDAVVEKMKDVKNVIIDIRGNGGGISWNAEYLMENFVKEKYIVHGFQGYIFPGPDFNINTQVKARTAKNYLSGKLVLLTDRDTFSAANILTLWFKSNKTGTVIGEKTGGGSHNVVGIVLPDNTVMMLGIEASNFDENKYDGEEGIEPDMVVENAVVNQKDQVLEAAVKYLEN